MSTQTLICRPFAGGGMTRFAAFLLASACCVSCAHAADAAIKIDNFTFTPATLTIAPGTTVTWTNGDDIPHSIVNPVSKVRSKPLDTGESYSFTFASAGRFEYFCGLHPHMKGMILVAPWTKACARRHPA